MSILMTILPTPSLLNEINKFIQTWEGKFSLNCGLFLLSWKSGLRVSEAVSFNYHLKHPKHKDLYLVHGKGNKKRYVYVSPSVINELKTNHWKPNQTNRFAFNNFLKKVKEKMSISGNIELTPHTLRRSFTTHNALNGVPMPILQKALGHKNIRTTSFYWKGSVDIREFGEWLKPDADPKEPDKVPKVSDAPQLPKIPPIPPKLKKLSPNNTKEPELLKTIAKLKVELAKKDKQLKYKDNRISLLTSENEKLRIVNHQKDKQLAKFKEKLREITEQNKSLIQNCTNFKNTAKKPIKNQANNNQIEPEPSKEKNIKEISLNSKENLSLSNNLSKAKKPPNNSLAVKEKEQTELVAEIQVWKPPN